MRTLDNRHHRVVAHRAACGDIEIHATNISFVYDEVLTRCLSSACGADLDITISCLEFPLAFLHVLLNAKAVVKPFSSRTSTRTILIITFSAIIAFNTADSNTRTRFFRASNIGRCRIRFCCDTWDRPEADGFIGAFCSCDCFKLQFFKRLIKCYSKYVTNAWQFLVQKKKSIFSFFT